MKKALCVGINDYPGTANDLQGCVNDANDWSALLTGLGFQTSVLLNSQATRANIRTQLTDLVTSAAEGDVIVFTYSGHGTQVADTGGDEIDSYDEAIYIYDGSMADDDLRVIIDQINPKATLVVISDSCFSGTVTRMLGVTARPRFMPAQNIPLGTRLGQKFMLPETSMPELLVSGCSDTEYSYDAEINGRANGAMSAMALKVIKQDPHVTYNQFYTNLRKLLPSAQYPQTPQLEGSDAHKNTRLFEPFPPPGENPPDQPPDDTLNCWQRFVKWLKGIWTAILGWFK
jgi:metacaspase-1